ncbi:transmembrane 9 superfamily member 1-like, partial [Stegodyphus dumicola]|uniref:transmembrane 9 superfamily member 1-like n=1 Tax=Stegodyphus dumicola TaxID=202533 RepID=UPI0015AF0661
YPPDDWLHVFADGLTEDVIKNSSAGAYSSTFSISYPAEKYCDNVDGQIATISFATDKLRYSPDPNFVFLIDSQTAILNSRENFALQWILTHCGRLIRLAKASSLMTQPDSLLPLHDIKMIANNKIKNNRMSLYSDAAVDKRQTYEDRLKKSQSSSFFPKTLETRVLRNDFARYNVDVDDIENMECDEYGWKIIRGDVFRFPPYRSLFCAILGVGVQFLSIALGLVVMALLDLFNVHNHGTMNAIAFLLYAFTSVVAGYVSASMYKQMGGKLWVWNINLTSFLFSGPFFIIWSIQNSIAWAYSSTQALPFTTILLLLAVWLCVGYPLCIMGGILGRNLAGNFDMPGRTKHIPREIPPVNWYHSPPAHCAIGGFLPFRYSLMLFFFYNILV